MFGWRPGRPGCFRRFYAAGLGLMAGDSEGAGPGPVRGLSALTKTRRVSGEATEDRLWGGFVAELPSDSPRRRSPRPQTGRHLIDRPKVTNRDRWAARRIRLADDHCPTMLDLPDHRHDHAVARRQRDARLGDDPAVGHLAESVGTPVDLDAESRGGKLGSGWGVGHGRL